MAETVLKDLIEERGIRQSFLAEKVGLSRSHFHRILGRSRPISADVAHQLAVLLEKPLDLFFDGQELRVSTDTSACASAPKAPPPASFETGDKQTQGEEVMPVQFGPEDEEPAPDGE